MKKTFLTLFLIFFAIGTFFSLLAKEECIAPRCKTVPQKLVKHKNVRIDDYFWLRERDNPEVLNYLQAENEYLQCMLRDTVELQQTLFAEMQNRIRQDDSSVPYKLNGYFYYTRYAPGSDYPLYCRKKDSLQAEEEILIDCPKLAAGEKFFNLGGFAVSPDNKLLAYSVDTLSRNLYTIYIKDLESGKIFAEKISDTSGDIAWANDNRTLFYLRKNLQTLRAEKVYRHQIGVDPRYDRLVYYEKDVRFDLELEKGRNRRYIYVISRSTLSDEIRLINADQPYAPLKIFSSRKANLKYRIEAGKDRFYVLTNLGAKNFRLMETFLPKTQSKYWREVIAHREDTLLEDFLLFEHFLILKERKQGLVQMKVVRLDDGQSHSIDFGEPVYYAGFSTNPEMNSDYLRFSFSSLHIPLSIFDYNLKTGEKILLKQDEVLGGFKSSDYQVERIYAPAADGVKIPISLVYRKGILRDGSNNLLLYGYGSYGYSVEPVFNHTRLSLIDRGFILAVAHIRGGQELGRDWYENGKLLKKKNTFTDFIACAEFLIKEKYTSRERLFAMGGSAGGLLIGAVINMRPDLFRGVIAAVPFVDVVTTMFDETIPLTTFEYDEWGDPRRKVYYNYMLSYSPYDNVSRQNYPAILVTAGLHDSQVQYWEPAKWVAKLRAMKTDNNPLLLYTNFEAGHGGASGRFRRMKELALQYAFLLKLAGKNSEIK